jgi:Uma2 family endonuclease
MGAQTTFSLEEYIRTSFDGLDKEYRDGELVERSLPDPFHGRTQALLTIFFGTLRKLGLYVYCDTRVKLRDGLILIPDVLVVSSEIRDQLPEAPPIVVVEILSRDDRHLAVRTKLEEYRAWGVPHVWLIDPYLRRLYKCDEGLAEVTSLALPEFGVELTPADLFE